MRILLIDDDALVTSGIQTIIETKTKNDLLPMRVVGIGKNGLEAISLYEQTQPDVVLMDIRMPEMDGITAGKAILSSHPDAKIIYLTTFLEDEYIVDALRIGAKGYLMKTDYDSLIPSIEAVMNNQRVFGDEIVAKIPSYMNYDGGVGVLGTGAANGAKLTAREKELVELVAEGLNNKEIAEKLHYSEGTVRNYLSVILEKTGSRDRTQLAIYYYKHGV